MTALLITSSVLILVVTALRYLLRGRVSPRLQYALWLLVAVRLLIPVTPVASPISVLNVVEARGAVLLPTVQNPAPAAPAMPGTQPDQSASHLPTPAPTQPAPLTTPEVLWTVWLGGAVVMGVWLLGSNLAFQHRLRRSRKGVEGLDCPLPVYVSRAVPSPCLVGLFRPAIYLTGDCLEDGERLRHILAHEYTHFRHRDHLWAAVRCLCLCLYWFDPLVWLAAALSRRDCELSCDEGTLRRLGEGERAAYGRTLLSMVSPGVVPADLLRAATTMSSGKRGLRERITLIARKPKMLAVTLIAVVMIVAAAVGCTFTGAEKGAGEPSPTADVRSLEERLLDLPEELSGQVTAETFSEGNRVSVKYYFSKARGFLCGVSVTTPAEFEQSYASSDMTGGQITLGRDSNWYYTITTTTDVQHSIADTEVYQATHQAVVDWVKGVIMTYAGVIPAEEDPVYQQFTGDCSYPGNHINVLYQPYHGIARVGATRTDKVYVLLLSQPVKQGEGGIWCVDRWTDGRDFNYFAVPQTDKTLAEYYTDLQAQADGGGRPDLLDPYQVADQYTKDEFRHWQTAEAFTVGEIYEGDPVLPVTERTVAQGIDTQIEIIGANPTIYLSLLNKDMALDAAVRTEDVTYYTQPFTEGYDWKDVTDVRVLAKQTPDPPPDADEVLTIGNQVGDGAYSSVTWARYFRFYMGSNLVLYHDEHGDTWYETQPNEQNPEGEDVFTKMWNRCNVSNLPTG